MCLEGLTTDEFTICDPCMLSYYSLMTSIHVLLWFAWIRYFILLAYLRTGGWILKNGGNNQDWGKNVTAKPKCCLE